MFAEIIFWGLTLFTVGACLFAFVAGSTAERMAAGVIVLNIAVGYAAQDYFPDIADSIRMANDGLAALVLLVLAVLYAAPWLGGCMLFYAAQFGLHSYFLVLQLSNNSSLHSTLNNFNFFGVTCCLLAGAWVTSRRRARRRAAKRADAASPAPSAQS